MGVYEKNGPVSTNTRIPFSGSPNFGNPVCVRVFLQCLTIVAATRSQLKETADRLFAESAVFKQSEPSIETSQSHTQK